MSLVGVGWPVGALFANAMAGETPVPHTAHLQYTSSSWATLTYSSRVTHSTCRDLKHALHLLCRLLGLAGMAGDAWRWALLLGCLPSLLWLLVAPRVLPESPRSFLSTLSPQIMPLEPSQPTDYASRSISAHRLLLSSHLSPQVHCQQSHAGR